CLQPARRRQLGLLAFFGALLIPPLIALGLTPRLDLATRTGPMPWLRLDAVWTDLMLRTWPWSWVRWCLAAYAVGVAWQLGWLALGWWGGAWLVWSSSAPSSGSNELFATLKGPGRRGPRLRVSTRVRVPVLFGGFRGTILIPPALDRPVNREALRLALLH